MYWVYVCVYALIVSYICLSTVVWFSWVYTEKLIWIIQISVILCPAVLSYLLYVIWCVLC